jgi:hypothetical protein
MDLARLQPAVTELSSAQSAYDTALKTLAAATRRAARSPSDPAAARAVADANAALTATRTRVESARVNLDAIRIAELATLETGDALLGFVPGNSVLSLFPVGVEARLEPGRLRVRVWPDAISTSTHDPRLTEKELDLTKRYWRVEAASTSFDASRNAWAALCRETGVTRAAWAAQILTPTNRQALGPGVEPVFPIVAMQDDAAPFVPRASVLPDRWIVIGTKDFVRVVERVGAPIPMDLAVGIDSTPSESAALTNREGEPIQLPPRMRWMTDFATAVQVGMALDIPVATDLDRIDELFVFGLRLTQTHPQNAATLSELLTGHRFSRGLAFVPQNTPTNNSVSGGSGMPSGSERVAAAFDLERRPRAYPQGVASNGVTAAQAFGIAPDVFASIPASGASAEIASEPDGFEPEAATAMQTALWQVTVGAALEDFLLIFEGRANAARDYFRHFVRAGGPIPAMRVGRQPYGVLPVTGLSDFTASANEGVDPQLQKLLRAARSWFAMRRDPAVFQGTSESALRHLGRSKHLFAETTQQNPSFTGTNRWASLSHSLAVASRNSFGDAWRNSRIKGTVESAPQAVTRAIVDASTAAEMTVLATALPNAILARPLPASVLGRMARHAALLEWSRFARTVIQASVDDASQGDLASKAAQNGSDIYITTLMQAMTEITLPPIERPPTGPIVARGLRAPLGLAAARRRDDDIPDLPEPDDPIDPDPDPVPVGEPAVNPAERQKIRTAVGSLAQPLATCPGAPRLASFRAALAQLAKFPQTRLESELFGVLDISNHRLDAWFTSLASRRLATLRAANPTGVIIGGWGCLLDVRRADPQSAQQRAEFIHTPSLDQAAAAAVLRSGARRAQTGGSSHADIDLSSRRVRLARWILEGVRNGRSLSDLLGVRFERAVKSTPAADQLGALRAQFPAFNRTGVLDGLALQQAGLPASTSSDVVQASGVINESLDAVADALTAEAVYQIVRGNPAGALINIDAVAAGTVPAELHVTETPSTGLRLTHRIAVVLPANAVAPGWTSTVTPRSRAEPLLDAWCGLLLGPATSTAIAVESTGGTTSSVSLSALGVAAIDVVFAGRNKGGELAELILRAAPASATPRHVREDRVWKHLVGLCDAIARVVTSGDALRSDSFDPPSGLIAAGAENLGDLPQRVTGAAADLTAVRNALVTRTDPEGTVRRAALFGVRVPGAVSSDAPTTEQLDALLAAVDTRLAAAAGGTPRERLRALFGGDLPGVVTFTPRDPATLTTATSPPPASLLATDPLAPRAWLDAIARTHQKAATLAEVLLRKEASGDFTSAPLLIAQAPWTTGDRWIATAFTSTQNRPPSGRLSVLMHAPTALTATQPMGGLLVDAWTETIPPATRDTAMALRFNNASTRAPQVILLAVNPNPAQAWATNTLVDVLSETLMLARMRAQPATRFSEGGLMPFAWLGQRPGNTGISFTL